MPKMTDTELRALIESAHSDSMSAINASKLVAERSDAIDYYLGDMDKDMPPIEGRSRAVSFDVADTIEGLMPSLMEIFTGSDEVVKFEPVGPEDVEASEQETDYVNHVFMQKNPGFMVLYSFIKDALMSKNGVVKVFWEEREQEERETYLGQPDDAFAMIVASSDVEVVEHTEYPDPQASPQPNAMGSAPQQGMPAAPGMPGMPQPSSPVNGVPVNPDQPQPMLHDVTVVQKKTYAYAKVMAVPPEEFGIARNARTIRDADYSFHKVLSTENKLIEEGYDPDQVKTLPSYTALTGQEEMSRNTVNEFAGDNRTDAARQIEIVEHYIRTDYLNEGKATLWKVTTGSRDGQILRRDGKPDIEPYDVVPFACMTPVPMQHRFFGRSLADLVMDIQRVKTALLRSLLDNAYLSNNPRVEVSETHSTDTTLDDLLVSRPGGIVRTKSPGGLNVLQHPNIGDQIYPLMQYQDSLREWRTGVSRQGQGLDANALQNQSATAANQLFTAAQARMKLIARIFAETGIRDMFQLLHATIRKHSQEARTVRLRNRWVTVDPRNWKTRDDMTVTVGLGTGGKSEQMAHMMQIVSLQKEALLGGLTSMVQPINLYNSAKEIVKLAGKKDPDAYFTNPANAPPQAQQAPPDPKMIEVQGKLQLERDKMTADQQHQAIKLQSDAALAQKKFELDAQMALLNHKLKERDQNFQHATQASEPKGEGGAPGSPAPVAPVMLEMLDHLRKLNGPKRIVRDAQGRPSHLEPMNG